MKFKHIDYIVITTQNLVELAEYQIGEITC